MKFERDLAWKGKNMPPQQQIAIAEACGWKCVKYDPITARQVRNHPESDWVGISPLNAAMDGSMAFHYWILPDYLNDLNAMHEAEKSLNEKQWNLYSDVLHRLVFSKTGPTYINLLVHSTAAQRAEAFLRTIGKWKD